MPDHFEDESVRRVLLRLPARERAAVVLRYRDGLSERQVATVLGCRPSTARMLAGRGLASLRTEFRRDRHRTALASTSR